MAVATRTAPSVSSSGLTRLMLAVVSPGRAALPASSTRKALAPGENARPTPFQRTSGSGQVDAVEIVRQAVGAPVKVHAETGAAGDYAVWHHRRVTHENVFIAAGQAGHGEVAVRGQIDTAGIRDHHALHVFTSRPQADEASVEVQAPGARSSRPEAADATHQVLVLYPGDTGHRRPVPRRDEEAAIRQEIERIYVFAVAVAQPDVGAVKIPPPQPGVIQNYVFARNDPQPRPVRAAVSVERHVERIGVDEAQAVHV